jgi:general secretion pathway protein D
MPTVTPAARRSAPPVLRAATLLACLLLLAACATISPEYDQARSLIEAGDVEQGLARLEVVMRQNPTNPEIRSYYYRQREVAVQRYLALAERARGAGQHEAAEAAYQRAAALDRENPRARAGLESVTHERRHRMLLAEAEDLLKQGDVESAYARARDVLQENSANRAARNLLRQIDERKAKAEAAAASAQLTAALRKPISLEFRDTNLRAVFELIAQRSGLNFIFDKDVPPDLRATVFVRNTTIDDAIRFVLVTNQLERKVLNENTLLIYPNTPAKSRDYRDLVVRSFYLANADVKQTANMIRSIIKTRDMYVDEKLNLLVMRDTAEAVRMAEKLVANQDLGEPEVMLEVEVLEVGSNMLSQIGVTWPGQIGLSLIGAAGTPGQVTLPEWLNRNSGLVRLTVSDPFFAINLQKQDGQTNVLANPRIRVKNREKARVHIGDRVPVVTTTTTATGFAAESVNYLDVGLKLEVEPQVFLEDEVGIKVSLEVSNIAREIRNASGSITYQVGTRNAATSLRLRDGETQVLAGLISDEDRRNAAKVPGLGDIPILGRLFSNHGVTQNKTEIVLLITPRVVRNLSRPDIRFEQFLSGTEGALGAEPLSLPPSAAIGAPTPGAAPAVPGTVTIPSAPPSAAPQTPPPGAPPAPPAAVPPPPDASTGGNPPPPPPPAAR